MAWGVGILVGLLMAGVLGFVFWRARAKGAQVASSSAVAARPAERLTPREELERLRETGKYSGVMVETHCRASSSLAGKKFPIREAPQLPLANCDAGVCACRYVGLPDQRRYDRRSGQDRREGLRMEDDRRSSQDRRKDANRWRGEYDL